MTPAGSDGALLGWAVDAVIASALLLAVVLLIRRPVRRLFGPSVAYALWALPLLRLLLPPLPQGWRQTAATPITRASETLTVLVVPVGSGPAATLPSSYPSLGQMLVVLWAAGAAAFLAWHLVGYVRFCRRILTGCQALDAVDGVTIVRSRGAAGPLAFGILRRYIAFPTDFADRYDPAERRLALAHELGHHQRCDLLANWIALVVLAIHWFDPLAWIAFRAFRADQELANDARVIAAHDPADRHAYGRAIVKAAHGGTVAAACHLHTITDLKGRLRMLATSHFSRSRLASGGAAVTALVVAGLGLTASGSSAAAISAGVKETIGAAQSDLPPPPVPPVPAAPAATPAIPAPPAPPAIARDADGKPVKRVVVRRRDKDGKEWSWSSDAQAALAAAPDVSERTCHDGADGGPKQFVIHTTGTGGKRAMIICTNRVETAAREGAEVAANSAEIQRNAMASAMAGLDSARATIAANRDMAEKDRTEALAAIEQARAEVREQMAHPDAD